MNKPTISVIIPTYNSIDTLTGTIESLIEQSFKPTEIVIVDNASTDNTKQRLSEMVRKNKLIRYCNNYMNLGVTGGRNRGIKVASKGANYLFFFDHDMVAHKDMLKQLMVVAESDEQIGIVTPKIYYWQDKVILKGLNIQR